MTNAQTRLISLSFMVIAAAVVSVSRSDLTIIGEILFLICILGYFIEYVSTLMKGDMHNKT